MNFINRVAELFKFEINNNILDINNKINNQQRNIIYNSIIQQVENVNEPNQYCALSYLTYLILSTFTKNFHHPYCANLDYNRDENVSSCINKLVNEKYINYITQGKIKLILMELYNKDENTLVSECITNILDYLSNRQLFIIMNINDKDNYEGTPLLFSIITNSHNLYGMLPRVIDGINYYNLYFDFEYDNEVKNNQVLHLENVYNEQDMLSYFNFAINKLFNSDCGIITLNDDIGMSHRQLAFCIYYCNHPTLPTKEKFHKFVNVLNLDQILYVGV